MSKVDYLKYNNSFLLNNYLSRDTNTKLSNKKINLNNTKKLHIISGNSRDDKYSFKNNLNLLKLKKNKQYINNELFNFFFNK